MGDISSTGSTHSLPYLDSAPGGHVPMVHGKPFLILGAELQNSSASCPEYMAEVWPRLKNANINTVLANVTWEAIESKEGVFNFEKLDQIVLAARRHGIHLILLWFGAFKNAKSAYVPSWVKLDATRFPRAMLRKARAVLETTNVLSIFSPDVVKADAAAFKALVRHVRYIDEHYSTVVMVQVENEVGLLGDSRDACAEANKRFDAEVPDNLMKKLDESWDSLHPSLKNNLCAFRERIFDSKSASWTDVFGSSAQTDQLFMAYHYALYVEEVTKAGKLEYSLPMFTNVWQNYGDEDGDRSQAIVVGGGDEPGNYPSGGGVISVLDIWQLFAPSLDFIAPDLYLNDYNAVCQKYRHRGQPLFIPEQRRDEYGARRIWSAYGTYQAICASPFGIDTMGADLDVWKRHFGLLSQVGRYLLDARATDSGTFGFFFDELKDGEPDSMSFSTHFGDWKLSIERSFVFGKPGPGFGMVIHLGEAQFLLVGEGFQVRFSSAKEDAVFTSILSFTEKVYQSATQELKDGRTLNGDETKHGEVAIMPNRNPDYGNFPIAITIPARTGIAECVVYALF